MDDRDSIQDVNSESVPSTNDDVPVGQVSPRRNEALMQALARIAMIHAKMGFTPGDRTQEYIREARAGGMFGGDA